MHKKDYINVAKPSSLNSNFSLINAIFVVTTISLIVSIVLFRILNTYNPFNLVTIQGIQDHSCRVVASIHGLLAFFFAGLYLKDYISLTTWRKLLSLSIGYFIFDLSRCLYYDPFIIKTILESIFHHIIVVLIIINYVAKYPKLSALGYLSEVSNFFLHTCWFLYKTQLTSTTSFYLSSICLIISFAWLRIYNYTKIWIKLYKENKINRVDLSLFTSFVLVNFYWFILLLNRAFKTFVG